MVDTSDLGESEYLKFTVALERVAVMLRRVGPARDLSLASASVLQLLDQAPVARPYRLTELAVEQCVTQPAMTQLVSRLEREGLARRCADPGDRRVVIVRITQEGQDLLRERRDARAAALGTLLAGLCEDDRRAIEAALPALERLALAASGGV